MKRLSDVKARRNNLLALDFIRFGILIIIIVNGFQMIDKNIFAFLFLNSILFIIIVSLTIVKKVGFRYLVESVYIDDHYLIIENADQNLKIDLKDIKSIRIRFKAGAGSPYFGLLSIEFKKQANIKRVDFFANRGDGKDVLTLLGKKTHDVSNTSSN